jgi:hypothetical protein
MKRIVVILLLCLPGLAYAGPSVRFASETHDFGHAVQGEVLEHTFEFTNSGTTELIIERIESS